MFSLYLWFRLWRQRIACHLCVFRLITHRAYLLVSTYGVDRHIEWVYHSYQYEGVKESSRMTAAVIVFTFESASCQNNLCQALYTTTYNRWQPVPRRIFTVKTFMITNMQSRYYCVWCYLSDVRFFSDSPLMSVHLNSRWHLHLQSAVCCSGVYLLTQYNS